MATSPAYVPPVFGPRRIDDFAPSAPRRLQPDLASRLHTDLAIYGTQQFDCAENRVMRRVVDIDRAIADPVGTKAHATEFIGGGSRESVQEAPTF